MCFNGRKRFLRVTHPQEPFCSESAATSQKRVARISGHRPEKSAAKLSTMRLYAGRCIAPGQTNPSILKGKGQLYNQAA